MDLNDFREKKVKKGTALQRRMTAHELKERFDSLPLQSRLNFVLMLKDQGNVGTHWIHDRLEDILNDVLKLDNVNEARRIQKAALEAQNEMSSSFL